MFSAVRFIVKTLIYAQIYLIRHTTKYLLCFFFIEANAAKMFMLCLPITFETSQPPVHSKSHMHKSLLCIRHRKSTHQPVRHYPRAASDRKYTTKTLKYCTFRVVSIYSGDIFVRPAVNIQSIFTERSNMFLRKWAFIPQFFRISLIIHT